MGMRLFVFLLVASVSCVAQPAREVSSVSRQHVTVAVEMPYLIVLPHAYGTRPGPWPIILYLHGSGDRGTDIALVHRTAAVQEALNRPDYPFILLAPQVTDTDQAWVNIPTRTAVMRLLDEVVKNYHGDPQRIYLTGISMGGWAAWNFAKDFPGRFAAIAPLCGDANTDWAPQILPTPVWTFHGTNDSVVPEINTERMIEALQKLGGDPKFTPVVGGDHDIAKAVYSRDDFYAWLLAHRLAERPSDNGTPQNGTP